MFDNFLYTSIWFESYWWHALFCIVNNCHGLTITTHAIKRHFLIWMTTVRQPMERQCSCVLTLKYVLMCVYWWMRQRIHNTLIVVDWYLRLMGDKTIPDSAEPRLESFHPPFVAGIDLSHQGVVDSYSLIHPGVRDKRQVSEIDLSQPRHETAFWWRHNGPVISQLTDSIMWPNYPWHKVVVDRQMYNCVWYFCI